jgi:hypothetical protein
MNTGIQDAWNLGWKLACVVRGDASEELLETYQAERWPVGRKLLRYTDRVFSTFTRVMAAGPAATWARENVVARLMPALYERPWFRKAAFAFVSELGIRYRRSPMVTEGRPRLRSGPLAGDRLPDAHLTLDGRPASLQRAVVGPGLALLACGDVARWDSLRLDELVRGYRSTKCVFVSTSPSAGILHDADESVMNALGAGAGAQYLVRPDGYVAFRCAGYDLSAVGKYLSERFTKENP